MQFKNYMGCCYERKVLLTIVNKRLLILAYACVTRSVALPVVHVAFILLL